MKIFTRNVNSAFTVIGFLISLTQASLAQDVDWKIEEIKADKFQILAPGTFNFREKEILTEIGTLHNSNYSIVFKEGHPNFLYNINVITYPVGALNPDSLMLLSALLSESIQSLEESLECRLQYSSDCSSTDMRQILFRMENTEKKIVVKGRGFIKGDRMYFVLVHTIKDNSLNDSVDKFLDSFRAL